MRGIPSAVQALQSLQKSDPTDVGPWSFRPEAPLVNGPGFQYDGESLESRIRGKGKDMFHQAPRPSQEENGLARGYEPLPEAAGSG